MRAWDEWHARPRSSMRVPLMTHESCMMACFVHCASSRFQPTRHADTGNTCHGNRECFHCTTHAGTPYADLPSAHTTHRKATVVRLWRQPERRLAQPLAGPIRFDLLLK
jgi:hypothetical protein